jgi:hypothetical protein
MDDEDSSKGAQKRSEGHHVHLHSCQSGDPIVSTEPNPASLVHPIFDYANLILLCKNSMTFLIEIRADFPFMKRETVFLVCVTSGIV